jgi:Tfp pilus assembly protein PilV
VKAGRQSGFSTLETLVAIAFLAICLAPLLTYQAQLASSAERLKRQSDFQSARQIAASYLMELTAADTPEGSMDLGGGWQLTWQGEPLGPPADTVYGIGFSGRYQTQLVRLEASLSAPGLQPVSITRYRAVLSERRSAGPQ